MKLVVFTGRILDWVRNHPTKALAIALILWPMGFTIYWKLTEHSRFNAEFTDAVWDWTQAGQNARTLDPQERWRLINQLDSSMPPDRWEAAAKLASWRESTALWPLIAAMQDDEGTRRTCVISQALGKLGDPAAVPSLIRAVQHPSNIDLRACAAHSLGEIGDVSAVNFLTKRAADVSLPEGERVSAVMALGEIGSPLALPALKSIANDKTRPTMRSFGLSAIHQIGLLQGDVESNLLAVLGDNSGWIQDDWILAQLYRRWDARIATGLNKILRTDADLQSGLRLHIAALLTVKQSMEPTTLHALGDSQNQEDRWLANLAERNPSDVQLLASRP